MKSCQILKDKKITSTCFPAWLFGRCVCWKGRGSVTILDLEALPKIKALRGNVLNMHIQGWRFTRELKGMLHTTWCRAHRHSYDGRAAVPLHPCQTMAADSPATSQLLSPMCLTAKQTRHMMSGKGNRGVKCLAKGYAASQRYSWKRALAS